MLRSHIGCLSLGILSLRALSFRAEAKEKEVRLVNVQVITRHGARTPITMLKNYTPNWECKEYLLFGTEIPVEGSKIRPYLFRKKYIATSMPGGCIQGQLTEQGLSQMIQVGNYLKTSYNEILPSEYDPSIVAVRSSDITRTLQSAEAVLFGMFPTITDTNQVIEIEAREIDVENIYPRKSRCKRLKQLQRQQVKVWRDNNQQKIQPIEMKVRESLGLTVTPSWLGLHNTFANAISAGLDLPENIELEDYKEISTIAFNELKFKNISKESQRLGIGRFLADLLDVADSCVLYHSNSAENQITPIRFKLYSAHDVTIAAVASAFGLIDYIGTVPPVASVFVIELYEYTDSADLVKSDDPRDKFGVRVVYNGEPLELPLDYDFVNDGSMRLHRYSTFRKAVERLIPENYEEECKEIEEILDKAKSKAVSEAKDAGD